jgi:hypothetical protein
MDKAISTTTLHRRQLRRWLVAVEALAILLAADVGLRRVVQPTPRDILTLTGDTGEVNAALTATGTVILAQGAILKSPIQSMLRRVVLVVGTHVVPGQLILERPKPCARPTSRCAPPTWRLTACTSSWLPSSADRRELDYTVSGQHSIAGRQA